MTSQKDVGDERAPTGQQNVDRGAATAVNRVERTDSVTDGVIRQLIDQIAQLQRASDMSGQLTHRKLATVIFILIHQYRRK